MSEEIVTVRGKSTGLTHKEFAEKYGLLELRAQHTSKMPRWMVFILPILDWMYARSRRSY